MEYMKKYTSRLVSLDLNITYNPNTENISIKLEIPDDFFEPGWSVWGHRLPSVNSKIEDTIKKLIKDYPTDFMQDVQRMWDNITLVITVLENIIQTYSLQENDPLAKLTNLKKATLSDTTPPLMNFISDFGPIIVALATLSIETPFTLTRVLPPGVVPSPQFGGYTEFFPQIGGKSNNSPFSQYLINGLQVTMTEKTSVDGYTEFFPQIGGQSNNSSLLEYLL